MQVAQSVKYNVLGGVRNRLRARLGPCCEDCRGRLQFERKVEEKRKANLGFALDGQY